MKKKIVIAEHIDENGMAVLEKSGSAEIVYFDAPISDDEFKKAVETANAVMVRGAEITRDMLQQAPKLEIIAKHGVGVDKIDVTAATEMKIPVTITPEANSDAVAELAMAMMLSLSRNLLKADMDLKKTQFTRREHYTGVELEEKTIGIIGLGRIGSRVARRSSHGFRMNVLAYDPFISADYAKSFDAELSDELTPLLAQSDYVTIHAPLTPLTRDMIGENELRVMKKDACIFNTARGGIIDEQALFRALSENWIKGAGLDVFVEEPPHPDHTPLLGLDNIIVTPHLGSGSQESMVRMATQAAQEIIRVLNGKRPKNPINPEIYE